MVSPVRVRVPPLLFSSILHGYGFPRTTLLGNLVNRGILPLLWANLSYESSAFLLATTP